MTANQLLNGGPAFPGVTVNDSDQSISDPFGTLLPPDSQATYSGMSMRDHFAALAMQASISRLKEGDDFDDHGCVWSYKVADQMLKARRT